MAAIKTLSSQYSMYFDMVNQVSDLYEDFERELGQILYEVAQSLNSAQKSISQTHEQSGENLNSGESSVAKHQLQSEPQETKDQNLEISDTTGSIDHPWLKKLFKKIALHCHPDKVDISDHRKLLSYEAARKALDNENEPKMISVGVAYSELPSISNAEIKKILSEGVSQLENDVNVKQKSLAWSWGMSEDNFEIKAKVLVHAVAEMYNTVITEDFALSFVKDFFEVNDSAKIKVRKIGKHPGPGLRRVRNKND